MQKGYRVVGVSYALYQVSSL